MGVAPELDEFYIYRMSTTSNTRESSQPSSGAGTDMVSTVIAAVRLRDAREHRGLERLFSTANAVYNVLVEHELGVRRFNERVILSHGTDWLAEQFCAAADGPPRDRDTIVKYARSYDLGAIWREVRQSARESEPVGQGSQRVTPGRLASRLVNGIFDDFCRRYSSQHPGAPRYRPEWKLRSIAIKEASVRWRSARDGVIRITGLPRLRFRLRQSLPANAKVRRTVRLVRRERGMKGVGPGRYELHFVVERPPRERRKRPGSTLVICGWDPGGRLVSDAPAKGAGPHRDDRSR